MDTRLLRAWTPALAVLWLSSAAFAQSAPVAVVTDPPSKQEEAPLSGGLSAGWPVGPPNPSVRRNGSLIRIAGLGSALRPL